MTTSTQHSQKPATPKQLRFLSRLAQERGVSYAMPRTSSAASREIRKLLAMKPSSFIDRNEDRRAIRAGFREWGGASAIRDAELTGCGSSAQWAPPDLDAEAVLLALEAGSSKCGAIAQAAELDFSIAAKVLARLVERGQVIRSGAGVYRLNEQRGLRT